MRATIVGSELEDIREKRHIDHQDVVALNFIHSATPYVFRKHFRQGLRSQLLQVLRASDVLAETQGVFKDGLRRFPAACPVFMLRIFKRRFASGAALKTEINAYRMIQRYLPLRHYAVSSEFVVDYPGPKKPGPLLCGLQEYVTGTIIDPWSLDLKAHFSSIVGQCLDEAGSGPMPPADETFRFILGELRSFVDRVKAMIAGSGYIPDIAGYGNLLLTHKGRIKLVDINNIARVGFHHRIAVDDMGYPVCDKSIEALFRLAKIAGGGHEDGTGRLYRFFMDPTRRQAVKSVEAAWHRRSAPVK